MSRDASAMRQKSLNLGASSVALAAAAGAGAPTAPAPLLINDEMGDAASRTALSRLDEAVAQLKAMTVAPLLRRAIAAIGDERPKDAADLALKALHRDERCGLGWYLLAIAREKSGDFKSSITCYEQALALMPNHADIANDLGRLAFRLNMKPVAVELFKHYRAAHPECPQGANNLACALRDLHQYAEAIEVLRPAIVANPESSVLWNTLGTVVSEQGDLASAMTFYDEALRFEPGFAKARYNRANTLLDTGDAATALVECERAMQDATIATDVAMMKLARSTMLICLGRLGEGWDAYEARLDPDFAGVTHFMVDRPRWTLDSDIAGKSLLLMGEQGLGDEVSFASILPDVLRALGPDGKLHLALEDRLISLFQRSFPDVDIAAHSTYKVDAYTVRGAPFVKDFSQIDLWAPLASMLRRHRRSIKDFPDCRGFLTPDPERVAYWRGVLGELPGLKVGLLWKSLKLDGARLRHFSPFEQWRPVLETPGITFVNMQYGDCDAELAQARETLGLEIWQPPGVDLKNDLDEVAALSCALDLSIGPANATTNIAAACGADVWLISTPAAWPRMGTDAYPYYSQVRVFIPPHVGAWDVTMAEVAKALAERV
jgi:tetratricopeptide (TPR) repeat protein